MEKNLRKYEKESEASLGSMTLIITVICIVGVFVIALLLQCLIKLLWKKSKLGRRTEQAQTTYVQGLEPDLVSRSIPEVATSPPPYENIHLYKKFDSSSCTPIYYNIPGTKHYYGITIKNETTQEELEEPPLYYSTDDENFEGASHLTSNEIDDTLPNHRVSAV